MNKIHSKGKVHKEPYTFKTRFIQWVYKVLCWISIDILSMRHQDSERCLPILRRLDKILYSRGNTGAFSYFKIVRSVYLKYISTGGSPGPEIREVGISLTQDGLPKILGDFIPIIRRSVIPETELVISDQRSLQLLNSLLWCTRSLKSGVSLDTSTIEAASWATCFDSKYSKEFWRTLGFRVRRNQPSHVPKALKWADFHFSTKSGPNGQALVNSINDLIAIRSEPELFNSIKVIGGEKLALAMDTLCEGLDRKIVPDLRPKTKETWKRARVKPSSARGKQFKWIKLSKPNLLSRRILRRLTAFPDKEGKTRVIAVFDYFSQTSLKPLHHFLYRILRRIPQDCTHNQSRFQEHIMNSSEYYSIDLTAWTDRFPIDFIINVLSPVLPANYLSSWRQVMVGLPFEFQGNKKISYSTGTPMGAYSSWASSALAHHYMIYEICRDLKIEWKTCPYSLLGDDIVICNKEVAVAYKSYCHRLGVEFSTLKTHESSQFFEFAKRMFLKGKEISPFPISALRSSAKRSFLLTQLLLETRKKEYPLDRKIALIVSSYYSRVSHLPSRVRKKYYENSLLAEVIMKIMSPDPDLKESNLNDLISHFSYPLKSLPREVCENIISNCIVQEFADSNDPEKLKTGKPLGELAFQLTLLWTNPDIVGEDLSFGMQLLYSFPIARVHGQVEEKYLKLQKHAYTLDTKGLGNWFGEMRNLTIPKSDQTYYAKPEHLESYAAHRLGTLVSEQLNILSKTEYFKEFWDK